MKQKRFLFTMLSLMWMGLIFYMSAQDADQSGGLSEGLTLRVAHVLHADFDHWPEVDQQTYIDNLHHIIRKGGHFTEYLVLGILLYITFKAWQIRHPWIIALLAAAFYAGTDEFHQLFVPGRSCELKDVLLDTSGALTGLILTKLVRKIAHHRTFINS